MIGYWISRMLDRICGLIYPEDIDGTDDEKWEIEDYE